MKMSSTLKTVLVASAFAASTLSGTALAQDQERDADGIYKNPNCISTNHMNVMLKDEKKESTGIKAISAKWNMEVYANRETGAWRLIGTSNDKSVPSYKSCFLAIGPNEGSLINQKFMKTHFAPYLALANN